MEESDFITTVSNPATILRYLSDISDRGLPLVIQTNDSEKRKLFHSSIQSIETDENQLVLHQLLPRDWQTYIQPTEKIEVSCRMSDGTINFPGTLSPLGNTEDDIYCHLSLPKKLKKRQLRAYFRISLTGYDSKAVLTVEDELQITGKCRDISLAGAQVAISHDGLELKTGQLLKECHISINDSLNLRCAAQVCHVEATRKDTAWAGLKFLDLDAVQLRYMKRALNQLERANINKKPVRVLNRG